ncbi:hypothetical protein HN858_02170 [Candidatus Falkowbacteria bacterium]|jgi:hypothetical protein|nr:hypothetical protein [Candidatus Falkowbacteria bacterium]MBT5502810.1 hypothetical protein [Candidatus Falkowbacteria bacterium]MBT7348461.1 hypothetical protein [Candidatus Falkowbacteria bacterium]MBT7501195.1 hypothetical protein [Candidatus Falkowbacteria bacterium]
MSKWTKLSIGVFFIGLAVFLLVGIAMYAEFFGFLMFYPYVVAQISGYGLNIYLAQVIALIAGVGLWVVIFKFFLSWNKKRRYIGFAIIGLIFISHSLVMYAVNYNTIVHPITGERKFCIDDRLTGRVKVYEAQLYDEFGDLAYRCEDDQVERFEIEKKYEPDENQEIDFVQIKKGFISPTTGKSIFYYCYDIDGIVRFFNMVGHCPWGGNVRQVTPAIVKRTSTKGNYLEWENSNEDVEEIESDESDFNFNLFAFMDYQTTGGLAFLLFIFCLVGGVLFMLAGADSGYWQFSVLVVFSALPISIIIILVADLATIIVYYNAPAVLVFIFGIPVGALLIFGYCVLLYFIVEDSSLDIDFSMIRRSFHNLLHP